MNNRIKAGILPLALFGNGITFFIEVFTPQNFIMSILLSVIRNYKKTKTYLATLQLLNGR